MIATISHDLRTPLTAIKGYQQLMSNGELTLEQQKRLQIAQNHAEELGNLVEHLFEYSYLINAEPKLNIERVNITNLITECLAAAVPDFEKRGIKVKLKETATVYAMVDQEMTVRIVQNLIRNCVIHSAGDVEVQILASENLENSLILFKNLVENPTEIDVNCLFERFYTRDKARSKTTGLGLSIVKLLAEQMGGTVEARLNGNELTIQVEINLCR
jgi:signal transduction histidine kinase